MTPCAEFFYVGFALGGKAVTEARRSGLPAPVLETIEGSRQYAEGRAVRLEVRERDQLASVLEIARIKIAN